jgi:RimJ/RimL family protein N-acetyltransferase
MDLLRGERVVLRPLRPDDADDLAAGCDDPLTQQFLPLLPGPYTRDHALWWINEGAPARVEAGEWAYGFGDPESDRLVGGGGGKRLGDGVAEIGYWVAPWARRRGVATEACRLLAAHVLNQPGTERLILHTQLENSASQRVALASGFTREGIERAGGGRRDGSRHDLLVWSRLRTDSGEPTPRLLPDPPGGELTDGVVALRPLVEADAPDTHALRSLPDVVRTSVPPVAPELGTITQTCARAQSAWLAGQRADFTIRDAATGAYTGEIGLYYWETGTQQAMTGYSLLPQWRGRGYTTRAVRLVAEWAFSIGIARLIAGTAPENLDSQRVLQRAGFEREGYHRSRLPGPNGTRIDDIQWVRLPDNDRPATATGGPDRS